MREQRSLHAYGASIRTKRSVGRGEWKGMRVMKGANNLKYVVFTARWWTAATGPCKAACTRSYVWITRNENLSYGIYHRRRDSRLESRLRRSIFRAAAIYAFAERSKSRAADDQRRVLRSTAALVASRRRRDGDEGLLMSVALAVFISGNCEIQTCLLHTLLHFSCALTLYAYHNLRS